MYYNINISICKLDFDYSTHIDITFVSLSGNGRLYDPVIARVLSPDNYVQNPYNPQNYNRYSYCYNNPLVYVDPDGNYAILAYMAFQGLMHWAMVQHETQQASIDDFFIGAIGGAFSYMGIGLGISGVIPGTLWGATTGGLTSGLYSHLQGGDFWSGAKQGAISGGVSGGIAGGIDAIQNDRDFWTGSKEIGSVGVGLEGRYSQASEDCQACLKVSDKEVSHAYGRPPQDFSGGKEPYDISLLEDVTVKTTSRKEAYYLYEKYGQGGIAAADGHATAIDKITLYESGFFGIRYTRVHVWDPGISSFGTVVGHRSFPVRPFNYFLIYQ